MFSTVNVISCCFQQVRNQARPQHTTLLTHRHRQHDRSCLVEVSSDNALIFRICKGIMNRFMNPLSKQPMSRFTSQCLFCSQVPWCCLSKKWRSEERRVGKEGISSCGMSSTKNT